MKASRVEQLMDILGGVEKLALSQVFESASQHDIRTLEEAIHDLSKVDPSLPDSEFGANGLIIAAQSIAAGTIGQQISTQGG
jgi:hypothetical protein